MLVNQASEWATQQDTPVAPAIQMEGFFVCKHEAQGNADKPIQQFFTWVAGDRLHSQPITRFCLDARKIFQLHDMGKKKSSNFRENLYLEGDRNRRFHKLYN
ncbi:hypothetical protein L798_06539 [Zootermopsis nevadensis]|uniref:Uncharacterized protein n=1 Tax=Zootermopsis nevadensis TaxID=136037 RepID=A0A067RGT9_ZOONE|nr:hypothetical protein L798_06539 [Zootermopsis nevadensis]